MPAVAIFEKVMQISLARVRASLVVGDPLYAVSLEKLAELRLNFRALLQVPMWKSMVASLWTIPSRA